MLFKSLIFLTVVCLPCLVIGQSVNGDTWITTSLKASPVWLQFSDSQRRNVVDITNSNTLSEVEIFRQLAAWGDQLGGALKQTFAVWYNRLMANSNDYNNMANALAQRLSPAAQPYGQHIVQILTSNTLTPNEEIAQVAGTVQSAPMDVRPELQNLLNQLDNFNAQQNAALGRGTILP